MSKVLAFDFGASSGRAILAEYNDGKLSYNEVHRFENVPIESNGELYWNFDELMKNVYEGIEKAGTFDSIGFDTWGVDFGLLDDDGNLIANPRHYRDSRTNGMVDKALQKISATTLYSETGNQIMGINTLFQLLASDLKAAKKLLFMPDLFAYTLCKTAACEQSIASTSQMFNPKTKKWSKVVLDTFSINEDLFQNVVESGTIIGEYNGAKMIAVAGHDTQCAVASLPAKSKNAAFLSCGTWSLFGTELIEPVLTEQSMQENLSNELGANGKVTYLKNIIGLWLIQESRRAFRRAGEEYSYADLERLALEATPLRSFIDPDAPEFTPTGDIPKRVQEFCRRTNQIVPESVGEIMRCIYESLALKYRYALEQLESVTGKDFDVLHILGGGTKDKLLCQMTANSCNIPVVAGPIEATALGNIIIQLKALGELSDIEAGRELISKTETLLNYASCESDVWNLAYQKYKTIL